MHFVTPVMPSFLSAEPNACIGHRVNFRCSYSNCWQVACIYMVRYGKTIARALLGLGMVKMEQKPHVISVGWVPRAK